VVQPGRGGGGGGGATARRASASRRVRSGRERQSASTRSFSSACLQTMRPPGDSARRTVLETPPPRGVMVACAAPGHWRSAR
jgi:hypothetical protein